MFSSRSSPARSSPPLSTSLSICNRVEPNSCESLPSPASTSTDPCCLPTSSSPGHDASVVPEKTVYEALLCLVTMCQPMSVSEKEKEVYVEMCPRMVAWETVWTLWSGLWTLSTGSRPLSVSSSLPSQHCFCEFTPVLCFPSAVSFLGSFLG